MFKITVKTEFLSQQITAGNITRLFFQDTFLSEDEAHRHMSDIKNALEEFSFSKDILNLLSFQVEAV